MGHRHERDWGTGATYGKGYERQGPKKGDSLSWRVGTDEDTESGVALYRM